ncbi:MAG: hypothetical protein HY858_10955 [Candidatus Solibacter usitatus]|nr:hypothetical protein [Candidatus Solibacter usitatus]
MTGLVLALLLLTAAAEPDLRPATVFDDEVAVAPSRFRTLDIDLPVEPGRIICTYEVLEGGSGVRLVLLKREDAARWLRGEAHTIEASTPFARSGAISHRPAEPDHYQLVLDNRLEGRGPARVHLIVRIAYNDDTTGPVRPADPRKGQILVWSSLGLFTVAAVYAGARLKHAIDRD